MKHRHAASAALTLTLLLTPPGTARAAALAARPPTQERQAAAAKTETDYYHAGRSEHERGRYGEAIKTFREGLKRHPRGELSDLLLLWLGRAQYRSGKRDDAKKTSRRLRSMGNADFAALLDEEITAAERAGKGSRRKTPAAN